MASALRERGMKVEQVSPLAGAIFGTVDDQNLTELRKLSGVLTLENEQKFQLPPMDDETPQ